MNGCLHIRAVCKEETRLELDAIDARVIFNSSTEVALSIIGLLLIFQIQVGIDVFVKQLLNSNPLFKNDQFAARTIIGIMVIIVAGICC